MADKFSLILAAAKGEEFALRLAALPPWAVPLAVLCASAALAAALVAVVGAPELRDQVRGVELLRRDLCAHAVAAALSPTVSLAATVSLVLTFQRAAVFLLRRRRGALHRMERRRALAGGALATAGFLAANLFALHAFGSDFAARGHLLLFCFEWCALALRFSHCALADVSDDSVFGPATHAAEAGALLSLSRALGRGRPGPLHLPLALHFSEEALRVLRRAQRTAQQLRERWRVSGCASVGGREETCAMCLQETRLMKQLLCGHLFHARCLRFANKALVREEGEPRMPVVQGATSLRSPQRGRRYLFGRGAVGAGAKPV